MDRVKALEALYDLLESGEDQSTEELCRALEAAAGKLEEDWRDGE